MAQREYQNIDVEDYLSLDQNSQKARYEYLDGELRMLAGGSPDHSIITANTIATFHGLLRKSPCIVYSPDMQFQLSESRYVYPDITISCDPRDQNPADKKLHFPTVVIEILSPSTETTDRVKKLLYYQAHPTIQNYMMIDSQQVLVEVHRREPHSWARSIYKLGDEVEVESLQIHFPVHDIYERTSLLL